MVKFKVYRYWQMSDPVEVEADSANEAIALAHELPVDNAKAQYVFDSLESDPDVDVYPLPERGAA